MVRRKTKEKLASEEEIKRASEVLKKGGVVIFPTDTVYGVGCKFDNKVAVARIYKIKGTSKGQPMPILIDNKSYLKKFGCKVSKATKKLIAKHWPGSLTLIFNSYLDKIGLRIPNHPITLSLIKSAGFPIIGTSANFHGKPAPKKFEEIDKNFLEQVDFILKGRCFFGKESTVVDTTVTPPGILRRGVLRLNVK